MPDLLVVLSVASSPALGITEEGQLEKSSLLAKAAPIKTIENEKARDHAIWIAGSIKAHLKRVEASRIEVKSPFLDISRNVDAIASSHVYGLEVELRRINRIVGEFEDDRQERIKLERDQLIEQEKSSDLAVVLEAEEKLEQLKGAPDLAKPKGGALRRDWDIEITDIKALYLAHPQCVELTAKNMAIKDLLKVGIQPVGVRATPKVDYAARANTKALPR